MKNILSGYPAYLKLLYKTSPDKVLFTTRKYLYFPLFSTETYLVGTH